MLIIIFLIIVIVVLFWLYRTKKCKVDLSMSMDVYPSDDDGYLKHMIHHHQVAVDMSEHLLKYTRDPRMISLCRDIIWMQKYEILQMNNLLQQKPYVSPLTTPRSKIYSEPPLLQTYYPKKTSFHEKHHQQQEGHEISEHKMHHLKNEHHIHPKSPEHHHHEKMKPKLFNEVVDRSQFFPAGDNPQQQIETFVNEGYYPNNPPLDDPLRNSNLQVRSEAPNLNTFPSFWNETTIKPDIDRRPLELKN